MIIIFDDIALARHNKQVYYALALCNVHVFNGCVLFDLGKLYHPIPSKKAQKPPLLTICSLAIYILCIFYIFSIYFLYYF